MSKELTIKPDQAIVAVGNQIDEIINDCLPVATQESQNFVQALTLANGIKALRHIFLMDENIKETVEAMQNTPLGFMTDRTDLAIWQSQQPGSKKELKPYRYEEVAEVCIEAMLQGYRITNNEFNMLVGRFYPAKNGKFRRIQEAEGVTDFQFTTTSPAYEPAQGGTQYAKVQAFASWKKDGQLATLGSSTGTEDKLIFKIRVNRMMGEDAIIGKALSKLFSRVLMRLEGKIMPEGTDISDEDVVEGEVATGSASDLADKIKNGKEGTARDLYGGKGAQGTDGKPPDPDDIFIAQFHGLKKGDEVKTGLLVYWHENQDKLRAASDKVKSAWQAKFSSVYGELWPQERWKEVPVAPQVVPGGIAMVPTETDEPTQEQIKELSDLCAKVGLNMEESKQFRAWALGDEPTGATVAALINGFDAVFNDYVVGKTGGAEGEELK